MKSIYNSLLVALVVCFVLSSCDKYLDVSPKSSVPEDEMFSSEIGFNQALAGVYSTIASRSLYGDNLSMGFVSALAQNYNTSGTSTMALFVPTRNYEYQSDQVLGYTNSIWNSAYNAIAAVNNILKYSDENRDVLSEDAYNQIRGEAFGLRAFLHFELLRVFAPSYLSGSGSVAIPYRTSVDHYSQHPTSVSEVIELALKDLTDAEELLKKSDPIFNGTMERQFKLNYYAIKGMEARINLYKGAKQEAYNAAKVVIDSERFPFVDKSTVRAAAATKNRLFRSELVFAVRNRDLLFAQDVYFTFNGSFSYKLSRPEADLQQIFEVAAGGEDDIRWVNLFEDSQGYKFPSKFWQTSTTSVDSSRLDRMVPVLRMSELRYIMAETAATEEEAIDQLNLVRDARQLPPLAKNVTTLQRSFIQNEITKEFRKEMYAEGQLFFYYKRLNFTDIPFKPTGMTSFDTKVYVLPIPEDELEFNPNY